MIPYRRRWYSYFVIALLLVVLGSASLHQAGRAFDHDHDTETCALCVVTHSKSAALPAAQVTVPEVLWEEFRFPRIDLEAAVTVFTSTHHARAPPAFI